MEIGALVVFTIENTRVALPLHAVVKVVSAVEASPLPGAPPVVAGVIDVHGDVVPVMDLRRRFGLTGRSVVSSDQMLLARAKGRTVALTVDRVDAVVEVPRQGVTLADEVVSGCSHVEGIVKVQGDLVLIHDLDTFLSAREERDLDRALENNP